MYIHIHVYGVMYFICVYFSVIMMCLDVSLSLWVVSVRTSQHYVHTHVLVQVHVLVFVIYTHVHVCRWIGCEFLSC